MLTEENAFETGKELGTEIGKILTQASQDCNKILESLGLILVLEYKIVNPEFAEKDQ